MAIKNNLLYSTREKQQTGQIRLFAGFLFFTVTCLGDLCTSCHLCSSNVNEGRAIPLKRNTINITHCELHHGREKEMRGFCLQLQISGGMCLTNISSGLSNFWCLIYRSAGSLNRRPLGVVHKACTLIIQHQSLASGMDVQNFKHPQNLNSKDTQ